MNKDFLIYPSALEKLKNNGIEERLNKLKKSEDGLLYIRLEHFSHEIFNIVNEMKEEGFYKNIPSEFKQIYGKTMNQMIKYPNTYFWKIETSSGERKIAAEIEDVDLYTGKVASLILSPDELWDFKRFDFSSASEFIGTVGAYILNESQTDFCNGYMWQSRRNDGSIITTEITGDSNADLRIFQDDITPYPSYDPFGNKINFKKIMRTGGIFAYHSEESSLLTIILKYIDQLNLDIHLKKDSGKEILKWAGTIKEEELVAATRFGSSFFPKLYFIGHPIPLPTLDENNSSDLKSRDFIHCYGEEFYEAYISHDKNLVFAKANKESRENKIKDIRAVFTSDDVENAIKGLFYQSIKHLGRTSAYDLASLLNYRFSYEFEVENERLKKEYNIK